MKKHNQELNIMTINRKSIRTHYTNSLQNMRMENKSNQDLEEHSIQILKRSLGTKQTKSVINNLGGYDTTQTGTVTWVT